MQVKGFGVKKIEKNITFGEITATIFVGLKKKPGDLIYSWRLKRSQHGLAPRTWEKTLGKGDLIYLKRLFIA